VATGMGGTGDQVAALCGAALQHDGGPGGGKRGVPRAAVRAPASVTGAVRDVK